MKECRIQVKNASNGYIVDIDYWNRDNQKWESMDSSWVCQDLERLIDRVREILVPEQSSIS